MFDIDIQLQVEVQEEVRALLQTAVSATLTQQNISPPASLSLVLTDDAQLQQLNQAYRQIDAPTDVLSFAAGKPLFDVPDAIPYLGDILISVPYASRQAEEEGHSLPEELQLLAVHGVLHLLGHDHMQPAQKQMMWAAQTAVLAQINVHISLPDEKSNA